MFVRVLGVRTLLQVLWFGVLEVSRFKCQRISSGLVFQFEGLVSKVSSDPFFFVVVVLWVYSLSDGFFRFSIFLRVLGVRTLL